MSQPLLWIGFTLLVLTVLTLDLGVFHREAHRVTTREAAAWMAVWVFLAMAFNVALYFWRGTGPALEFLTGYLIEESLSVDNMFVFLLLFSYFAVPSEYQHRVLFWGIVGALVMRAAFIVLGTTLLARFHWVIYVFGGFLAVTGLRMAAQREIEVDPEANPVLRLARRVLPLTERPEGQRFLVRRERRVLATPLLLVLVMIETTDVVFAMDSIPAVFAVTRDPFIVYTSNIFAVLGLRSLYFLLAGIMGMFRYLKYGLAVILTFVGLKMLLTDIYELPILASLGVVFGVLAVAVLASVLVPERSPEPRGEAGS